MDERVQKGLQGSVKGGVHVLNKRLQKVDVTVSNTASMLAVKEVTPSLQIFQKRHIVALGGNDGGHNIASDPWVLSSKGKKPDDLVATEFCHKMPDKW